MLTPSDVLWALAKLHQRDLVTNAERERLLSAARRHRRSNTRRHE
jgi:hypothetical protein